NEYEGMTIRELHYQLVGQGFPNDVKHYKRVISAMTYARWEGLVDFNDFEDHERSLIGETKYQEKDLDDEIENAKDQIKAWLTSYYLDRWSNQPNYVEVWVEKKALQGTFTPPCESGGVGLFPCKGYPSLTWLNKARDRFEAAIEEGKEVVIIYFGDYDPSGEDIPRSIQDNLCRMGVEIELDRIALLEHQVIEWNLPPAPTKIKDTRSASWNGIGQVELDAIKREKLQGIIKSAIEKYFDVYLYTDLRETESEEETLYQKALKEWVADYEG
ncbi:hypothetical protein LCGC14_2519380, partial [marine sediment metagenome]